ncbi:hypothetical protein ASE93_15385 [Serratia sp. Leaf50]|uniref:hypothetical protein n=1 Tax=Rouxiella sp. S1S-2 TaxID=2653856 RepID=UPI0006F9A1B0|nr:hypothetical protein [Rouxiella sp. S1S-2]KAB7896433.1 hypothetical protein GA565_10805 [Rouxiella sp. S1S-2]KQN46642.1 hypothetical protein ASE93_15385 [Serratia sp. Leaf50]
MNQADIEDMIQQYLNAEKAVLQGKSITFNGQSMTMENLSEIRSGRESWERRLSAFMSARRRRPQYKLARFPR